MSLPELARPAARLCLLLVVAVVILPAGSALAQSSPFGSLPDATPDTQTQTTISSTSSTTDDGLSTWQGILVVVTSIAVITGIGLFIASDARRRAPVTGADSESAHLPADAHKRGQATKRKQRAKAKAARQQRKHNR